MSVERGRSWGSPGVVSALTVAPDDATAAAAVTAARRAGTAPDPLCLTGGDLHATLGRPAPVTAGQHALLLPCDVGAALVDGRLLWFVAHLVVRRSWWRGRVVAVMNAEFVDRFDVAPRAHPGDGLLDVVDVDPAMGLADRWRARQRLRTGAHLPHPSISVSRTRAWQSSFDPPAPVWLDGVAAGTVRHLSVRVEPDAVVVAVPG